MKRIAVSCFSFIIFLSFLNSQAQTTIPGDTEVSGIWTKAESPYLIEGDIIVPNRDTLIIESGVRVEMMGWHKFNVEGHFEVLGTEGDTVVFTTHHSDSTWHGLRFNQPDDTVILQYVKIENGHAKLFGSGLTSNRNGGGIYGFDGNYIIEHSLIQNNDAITSGGGLYFRAGARIKIVNTTIRNNQAEYGGGILLSSDQASLIIYNSTIINNYVTQNGGGINCNYTPFSIYNSEISGNTARWGGGIYYGYTRSKYILISNSLISQNTAERGSGIYSYGSDSKSVFSQCTFADNLATSNNFFGTTITTRSNKEVYFSNCILYENQNYNCLSTEVETLFENTIINGNESIIDHNQIGWYKFKYSNTDTDFEGVGNINENPLFSDPNNGNFSLSASSPCINAGNPSPLYNDPDDTRNDMGVYGGSGLIVFPANDTIDYGPAAAGDIYYIDLINARNEPVTLQSINFSAPGNFSCSKSFPLTISALDSIRIPIKYLANSIGEFSETLTLTSSDFYGTTEATFQLTGYSGTFGELTGTLSKSNSPYLITGDITVPENETLTIEPGVVMQFAGRFQINVYGQFQALGTESDTVYFETVHPDSLWGGIRIMESQDNNSLKYVSITRASSSKGLNNLYDTYGSVSCREAKLFVEHSKFSNNTNHYCAGISGYHGQIVINNALFQNNNADYSGMIFMRYGNALLNGLTFSSNEGGALHTESSEFVLSNSVITNQSDPGWGHFRLNNSTGLISNCVIYDNYEWRSVFDVYNSNLEILNSIIRENGDDMFEIGYQSLINAYYSNIEGGYEGIGIIDADPNFEDPANGDFRLADGSPCIDTGFPSSLYNDTDGSRNDMGAYGGNDLVASPPSINFQNTGKGQEKSIPLKIYNLRETSVNLSSITITDEDNFSLGNSTPGVIESFSADTVIVHVVPVETGQLQEYIVLESTDLIGADTAMISVSVNAGYWQGDVSGTWTKENSPYILGGSVTVPEGQSLTIEPGVLIQIDTGYAGSEAEFKVLGNIQATGEASDPIIFSTIQDGVGLWQGIILENTGSFDYCTIENATNGVEVRTRDISISNCDIRNNSENGIYWSGSDLSVAGSVINSTISNNWEYGIYCYADCFDRGASATPLIQNNIIQNNVLGGILVKADGYTPSGWTAASRSSYSSPEIHNNFIRNNNGPGVKIEAYGDFAEGTPTDIRRRGHANPRLINNAIYGNDMAIDVYESSFYGYTDIVLLNNTLWNNGAVAVRVDRGTIDISNTIIWGDQSESIEGTNEAEITVSYSDLKTIIPGNGNISEDPLLVSPGSNDFNIECSSPCVNTGNPVTDTTGFQHDIYDKLRIYAGVIDIGAAENQELPQITQQPSDLEICAVEEAELETTAEGDGLVYRWYLPGSATPVGENSKLIFDPAESENSGAYFCTVTNHCNVLLYSDTVDLLVHALPTASVTGDADICAGEDTVINIGLTGTDPWNVTIYNGTSNEEFQTSDLLYHYSVNQTGTYEVISLSDAFCAGEQFSGSATVNVHELPTSSISGDNTICEGEEGQLTVALTGSGPWSFTWSDGANQNIVNTSGNQYILDVTPGIYEIIKLSDLYCQGQEFGDTFTASEITVPVASFDFSISAKNISFTNTSEMATDYSWDFGDGGTSSEENPSYSYPNDNEYTVILTASNTCGDDEYSVILNILTALEDHGFIDGFRIYPNPTSDIAILEFAVSGKDVQAIHIFDLNGKFIRKYEPAKHIDKLELNMRGLANGVYLIRIDKGDEMLAGRIELK